MKHGYIFVFLTPIITLLLLELFFFYPKFFYISLILVNLLIVISIKKITNPKTSLVNMLNSLILPILFSTSLMIYSILLTSKFFIHFLFIVNFFFIYYYLKNIYLKGRESSEAIGFFENVSSYGNFLTLFFTFSAIYGMKSFLNTPIWPLVLIMAIIVLLVIYESLWTNRLKTNKNIIYIFLICLILTQIAWSIYFLPLNYNTLGLTLAICYYILIGVVRFFLRKTLDKKTIKLYLIFGLLSIVLIFLTASWA